MVVVDASVVIALFTAGGDQATAQARFRDWVVTGEEPQAPAVMPYEVMNVLARQLWDGELSTAEADAVWSDLDLLGITLHRFDMRTDGPRSLTIARLLRRRHVTDCAYVSLAERLGCVVWTLDTAFVRAASGAGLPVQFLS